MLENYCIRLLVAVVFLNCVHSIAIFDRNYTKPYVLKKTWVQNFIKFQYIFEGKQRKAKIVPLGCVPSNTENGKVLEIGEKFHGHDFIFSCEQGEDGVLNYEAVACVDAFGVEMHPGETRRLSNGTVVLHCNIFGGALKKVVERTAGCYYNETIYGEEVTWVEPLPAEMLQRRRNSGIKNMVMRSDKSSGESDDVNALMTGKLMQCFRPHYSYFESHVIGCVIGRLGLLIDQYAEVEDGSFVKCVESELGFVQLQEAKLDDLACEMDNATFAHRKEWDDPKKAAVFSCNYGNIQKTECLLDNQRVPIGMELRISNGCVFLCHPQANVYICEEKLGDFKVITDESEDTQKPQGKPALNLWKL